MRSALPFVLTASLALGCGDDGFFTEDPPEGGAAPGDGDGDGPGDLGPRCVVGAECEFDAKCCPELRCFEATCQERPCELDGDCPEGQVCDEGVCRMKPPDCTEVPECALDADCAAGEVCVAGCCAPPDTCEDDDPGILAGAWMLDSVLYLGDGIDGFFGGVLDVVDQLEDFLCPVFAEPWMCAVLGLLSDINDMMEVMYVEQRIVLASTGGVEYAGTEEWVSVAFELDGEWVEGDPEDIYAWEIRADDFTAHTSCGVAFLHEHHVTMRFCDMIRWAIDAAVWASSDGAAGSLEELVDAACGGNPLCYATVDEFLDDLIGCGGLDLLGFDYAGEALIASPDTLADGIWHGDLDLGGSFPGTFTGARK